MSSTITLQSVLDWCRTQPGIKGQPLSGMLGMANEPGLSMCNNTIQELFCAPNNWRFNKSYLAPGQGSASTLQCAFTTVAYQQDYVISGATAEVVGVAIIPINSSFSTTPGATEAATTVTINTGDSGPHPFIVGQTVIIRNVAVAGYNGSFPIATVPNNTSFTYTTGAGLTSPTGGPGVTDINWVEGAVFQDYASTATIKPVHDVETVFSLRPESIVQNPIKIAFQSENTVTNTITIRTWPVSGSQIWGIQPFYQKKPPVFTDLSNTWGPWPDELSFILRAGVKWQAFLTASDPRTDSEYMKFQQNILKGLDLKQQELRSESYFPDLPISRGG